MQTLPGMDLVAEVAARLIERVENRPPAPRQLVERRLDQARRPRGPGIEIRPRQRAGKRRMLADPEPARRARRELELLDRPGGTRLPPATHLPRPESVKSGGLG